MTAGISEELVFEDDIKIVFFDSECILCSKSVHYIMEKDFEKVFRFASLKGETAKKLLTEHERNKLDTVIFYQKDFKAYQSDAVIEILYSLRFPYSLSVVFLMIPRPIRDIFYRFIAKRRKKWFGTQECFLPTYHEKSFFLD